MGEPTSVFAELTTLEQYVFTSSNGTGKCCPPVSLLIGDPGQEVWVVAFRGTVRMTLPSSGGEVYDNITFALDARTGKVIGTDAYPPGHTIPYKQSQIVRADQRRIQMIRSLKLSPRHDPINNCAAGKHAIQQNAACGVSVDAPDTSRTSHTPLQSE